MKFLLIALSVLVIPSVAIASNSVAVTEYLDLTGHWVGVISIAIFALAYVFVMSEEFTHLRKSKPVILAAGLIWTFIAIIYANNGMTHAAEAAVRHNLLEYSELMLFLLVAMTYVNALSERQVFDALRSWLIRKGFNYRQLFWLTGVLSFIISPINNNMTTALLMCAVVLAVGSDSKRFVSLACINIVVSSNAGGAFSPFGDITTLMVWQKGMVDFWGFFALFIPAVINFVIPASIMHFAIPDEKPKKCDDNVPMRRGAVMIMVLFLMTVITAVVFHNSLHLPPVLGMMTGLAYLQFFGFYLRKTHNKPKNSCPYKYECPHAEERHDGEKDIAPFDVFQKIERAEWDTLLFFYGVVLAVGGLGFIGYLGLASEIMYDQWGATSANVTVGVLSAVVDNIPVMFAVLTMNPEMSQGQWLLVTLTAGVGGSLLSVGSASGVALMGQAPGQYTFMSHLKWTPVIALGYFASILAHLWINSSQF